MRGVGSWPLGFQPLTPFWGAFGASLDDFDVLRLFFVCHQRAKKASLVKTSSSFIDLNDHFLLLLLVSSRFRVATRISIAEPGVEFACDNFRAFCWPRLASQGWWAELAGSDAAAI